MGAEQAEDKLLTTVEIDDTSLTVYLAASQAPASIDELRQLTIPTAGGPIPL